jgi:hydrogenase maturation protease
MWLIIGYGNRLREDDGAGPALAELLEKQLCTDQVRVLTAQQLVPELVEELVQPDVDQVLFIDVRRDQANEFCFTPLDTQKIAGCGFGHQQQPETLLFTAQKLYSRSLPGWLLTLPGSSFSFGEQFSSKTRDALDKAPAAIQGFMNSCVSPQQQ